MKKLIYVVAIIISSSRVFSQDTFSIVAVDSATGEVGSCGASCINGSIIISDLLPNIGAIHTQSYWNTNNQQYANQLMLSGHSPQQIIDSLVVHDAQGDSTIRQYGVVDLNGGNPRSASFTGSNCFDEKFHRVGPNYAIQGNILIDSSVIDSIESRFLNANGDLAHRLMAAIQGANIPGADSRCLNDSTSSKSSFIRVAKPTDSTCYYLDINVNSTPTGVEPIDSLQKLFDSLNTNCDLVKANIYHNRDTTDLLYLNGAMVFSVLDGFESCRLWDFGDGNTSTTQTLSHTYTSTGTYEVTLVVNNYGCSDTSSATIVVVDDLLNPSDNNNDTINDTTVVNDSTSFIGFRKEPLLNIYPNPAMEEVTIELKNLQNPIKLEITNVDGKVIYNQPINTSTSKIRWDSRYRKGYFIVRLYTQRDIYSEQLIIR